MLKVRDLDRSTGGLATGAYLVSLRPEAAQLSYQELHRDLGLAIAAGLVRAHRGSLSAHNLDRGARFEVRLPIAAG